MKDIIEKNMLKVRQINRRKHMRLTSLRVSSRIYAYKSYPFVQKPFQKIVIGDIISWHGDDSSLLQVYEKHEIEEICRDEKGKCMKLSKEYLIAEPIEYVPKIFARDIGPAQFIKRHGIEIVNKIFINFRPLYLVLDQTLTKKRGQKYYFHTSKIKTGDIVMKANKYFYIDEYVPCKSGEYAQEKNIDVSYYNCKEVDIEKDLGNLDKIATSMTIPVGERVMNIQDGFVVLDIQKNNNSISNTNKRSRTIKNMRSEIKDISDKSQLVCLTNINIAQHVKHAESESLPDGFGQ